MHFNKLTISLSSILLLSFSSSTYAVTDQINHAIGFLSQSTINSKIKSIESLGLDDSNNVFSNDTYYKNIKSLPSHFSTSIKKDIQLNSSSNNKNLQQTILEFQTNNNLTTSGVIDDETKKFINSKQDEFGLTKTNFLDPNTWFISYNQPTDWQIKTVLESLTDWENVVLKQSNSNSNKFIVVNIPNMRLTAYDWDQDTKTATQALLSRVVVGSPSHQTPLEDMNIWGIKYNPDWTPTPNIVKRSIIKNGKINKQWLSKNNITVIDKSGTILSHDDVSVDNFKSLRFVQPSGDKNALGLLKFETNSKNNIYLHDTNDKRLFTHNSRAASSGCIRVDEYLQLASWINNSDPQKIVDRIHSNEMKTIRTNQKIPVYITYTQAYFDDPIPAFAPDVYQKFTKNSKYLPTN